MVGSSIKKGGRVTSKVVESRFTGSVLWLGPFLNHSGYGEEARGFLKGLVKRGVPVAARSTGDESSSFIQSLRDTPDMAVVLNEALNRSVVDKPITAIVHLPGYGLSRVRDADYTIGRTMFETDSLPLNWVERINLLDEVWVPASFNLETFRRAGVHIPIEIVPSPVDASQYRPGLTPLNIPGRRQFVFLAIFEWSHRKAPDVVLDAWARAFRPDDDVCLVLRSYGRTRFNSDSTQEVSRLVDAELAAAGRSREEVAPIIVLGQQLSAATIPRLISAADVFIGVSRGEGWGRPMLEAMASGLPVIGTRWGGNLDFMDDDNSLLTDIDGLSVIDDRMDVPFYRGQRWAEPSREHLADLLRQTARDHDLRRRLGRKARQDVERRWQYQHVARVVEQRLIEVSGVNAPRHSTATPMEPPRVRWFGDIFADHSLATVNRELLSRLAPNDSVTLETMTTELPPFKPEYVTALKGVSGVGQPRGRSRVALEVRHSWPPNLTPASSGKLVIIQPWEFGGIPSEWISPMVNVVDEIWVPTSWVRECYIRSGISPDKVVVVPNGVDVETFTPEGPQLTLSNRKSVRLLFVGGTISRKGFDILLDSYLETFGPDDDVCLVIKPFGADSFYKGMNLDDRIRDAIADRNNPSIELVERRLSRAEMAMLYRSCNMLVHPYRGEGFGLPIAEAMACGLPTIVTGYGACLDFCDTTTSWLIGATEASITMPSMPPGPAGYWLAEPNREQFREILRKAVGDVTECRRKGSAARVRAVQSLNWDLAAQKAMSRLSWLIGESTRNQSAA